MKRSWISDFLQKKGTAEIAYRVSVCAAMVGGFPKNI